VEMEKNVIAHLQVFGSRGIIGMCKCKGPVDIVRPSKEDKPKWFTAACLQCNKQWKSANSIEEAVNNFGNDLILEV